MHKALTLTGLWLFAGFLVTSTAGAGKAADETPAYIVRGRQTEARQRELREQLERFHAALAKELQRVAPDLLSRLEPPPVPLVGYQVLPRIVPDASPRPLAKPQVVSYSWAWSDTLIAREMATLDRLATTLAKIPPPPATVDRAIYESLAADYKTVVDHRRSVDADIAYNWLWQAAIAADRPGFDRLTRRLDDAVARQARPSAASALEAKVVEAPVFSPPAFVHIEQAADHQWVFRVPFTTDIDDPGFVQAFKNAVEATWHLRTGQDEFQVQLDVETISPERLYCDRSLPLEGAPTFGVTDLPQSCAPPRKNENVDLSLHSARFPQDRAALTTGAASLRIVGHALVVSPHDITALVLAHEFGHMVGLPEFYFRGYRDLDKDGFKVLEFVPDAADLMASPGTGRALAYHFKGLLAGRDLQRIMQAGLEMLYQDNDPIEAIVRFRQVLERNPGHYGATLQLAKALDRAGSADEALPIWKQMLTMAEAARDGETARTVQARLAGER